MEDTISEGPSRNLILLLKITKRIVVMNSFAFNIAVGN